MTSQSAQTIATPTTRATAVLVAMLAMTFGAFLVYGAAFANPTTLHNATHDVRHAIGSPCH